jgi:hypothetical protein
LLRKGFQPRLGKVLSGSALLPIALDEISAVIDLSFVLAHGEQTGIKKQQAVRHCFSSIGHG